VAETLEIAGDVARRLIEARREREALLRWRRQHPRKPSHKLQSQHWLALKRRWGFREAGADEVAEAVFLDLGSPLRVYRADEVKPPAVDVLAA